MIEPRTGRYALFLTIWFVIVPLVGALALVLALSGPAATESAGGILSPLKNFGREQPVPLGIIAFTVIEMILWSYRHVLPGAGTAAFGGRADLPRDLRRPFEAAKAVLDEAERICIRRGREVERSLSVQERDDLRGSLDDLRKAMAAQPFEVERFRAARDKVERNVDLYLGKWRKSELREYTESIGIAVAVALLLRAFVIEAFKIPSPSMVPTLQVGDHIFVNKSSYGPEIPFTDKRLFANMPPHYGDVMVFQYPENPEQDFIKRVVALPGDTLEAIDGRPVINGWRAPECKVGTYRYTWGSGLGAAHEGDLYVEYLGNEAFLAFYDTSGAPGERKACTEDADCEPGLACRGHLCGDLQGPYHVKAGEVWVMGDNRNNSHDSRGWWEGKGGGVPFSYIKGRALVIWMSFAPSGGIAWDRIGINVMGSPKMPPGDQQLQPAVDRCFANRPPLSQTTPPPPPEGRP